MHKKKYIKRSTYERCKEEIYEMKRNVKNELKENKRKDRNNK